MSTNVTVDHGVGGQPRQHAVGRWTRGFRAFYASLLVAAVVASLLPAVLFQANSRVFMLKIVAVAILASMRACSTWSSSGSRATACTTST